MVTVNVSATELAFLAAAVDDKIAAMDRVAARIAAERERLGASDPESEQIGLLIRTVYVRLARMLGQQLDVPFMDQDEAVRMLFAEGTVVVGVRS